MAAYQLESAEKEKCTVNTGDICEENKHNLRICNEIHFQKRKKKNQCGNSKSTDNASSVPSSFSYLCLNGNGTEENKAKKVQKSYSTKIRQKSLACSVQENKVT